MKTLSFVTTFQLQVCVVFVLIYICSGTPFRCSRHGEADWRRFIGGRVDEGSQYDCPAWSPGGQCVALLKCECGLPATGGWQADIKISDVCGPHGQNTLPIGTAIATFDSRYAHYGNRIGPITDHAAVFLGCTPNHGVKVLEQGCTVAIQTHEYTSNSDYFNRFYSIKCWQGTSCTPYPSSLCKVHLKRTVTLYFRNV